MMKKQHIKNLRHGWCVDVSSLFEHILSEIPIPIPPNLDNWARWPISSSADAVIPPPGRSQRLKDHDKTLLHFTMLYTKKNTKQTFIELHWTPSSYTRLPIRRFSPDWQQLLLKRSPWGAWVFWDPSIRRCHASFGRTRDVAPLPLREKIRNQTATATSPYTIGSLCRITWAESSLDKMFRKNHELSPQLYLYLFVILEENSKQNCFACLLLQMVLEYVDITKMKERNMSCTSTGLQVHSLPSFHYQLRWRPPKHHTLKSVQSIHSKTVGKKNASILLSMIY